jgi:DNA (cytosine-5)-methyltransferase 1
VRFGSLFSGIGGIDLGLERAGFHVAWQVELDDHCNRVLSQHWPDVPRHRDVREVGAHNLNPVDLIAGGFPCQDISAAGKRVGIDGERSGLWREFARIIGELRPRYVLVENVSALLGRGMGRVLGDLAACGYDAEWDCIPAAAVGAPHIRDRVFVVAYRTPSAEAWARGNGLLADAASRGQWTDRNQPPRPTQQDDRADTERGGKDVAHAERIGSQPGREAQHMAGTRRTSQGEAQERQRGGYAAVDSGAAMADATGARRPERIFPPHRQAWHDARGQKLERLGGGVDGESQWATEPSVGRLVDGVSPGLVRPALQAYGNAVVPQVAEYIGRLIMSADGRQP